MIKLAYLAYDLMNLYGDVGNIKILKHYLGDELQIINIKKGDSLNFDDYDFIYMGAGTEKSLLLCLEWLRPYKAEIFEAIKNKPCLFSGNSFEILGKSLMLDDKTYEGLNIFNFDVKIDLKTRETKDFIEISPLFSEKIIGFINRSSKISNLENSLFENKDIAILKDKFLGINLCGPVLLKNPQLLNHYLKMMKSDFEKPLELEYKAYNMSVKNLNKN